jgi:hypothetical protein
MCIKYICVYYAINIIDYQDPEKLNSEAKEIKNVKKNFTGKHFNIPNYRDGVCFPE